MITFVDIETTGLPPQGRNDWEKFYDDFPYIVQIAWIITDDDGVLSTSKCFIIKPDGYNIPQKSIEIHGISQQMALDRGEDIKTVLDMFIQDIKDSEYIVGHNLYFDTSIIKANMLRYGYNKEEISNLLHKDKRRCTMRRATEFFKLSKWPKLTELYQKLFGVPLLNAHSAMSDVMATKDCYFELIKLQKK
jgi:DNA polymerase III epsilon subunit-like protein